MPRRAGLGRRAALLHRDGRRERRGAGIPDHEAQRVLTRFISSMLFGVSSTDAVTYVGVSFVLVVVAVLASYLPARRATQIDPLVALRQE